MTKNKPTELGLALLQAIRDVGRAATKGFILFCAAVGAWSVGCFLSEQTDVPCVGSMAHPVHPPTIIQGGKSKTAPAPKTQTEDQFSDSDAE